MQVSPPRDQMRPIEEQDNLGTLEAIETTSNDEGTTKPEVRLKLKSRNHRRSHSMCQKTKSNFCLTKHPPPPRRAQPVKHPQEQRPLPMTRPPDQASGTIPTKGQRNLPRQFETM